MSEEVIINEGEEAVCPYCRKCLNVTDLVLFSHIFDSKEQCGNCKRHYTWEVKIKMTVYSRKDEESG